MTNKIIKKAYTIAVLLIIFSGYTTYTMEVAVQNSTESTMTALKAAQSLQLKSVLATIPSDALKIQCNDSKPGRLNIPFNLLIDDHGNPSDLKALFEKHKILTGVNFFECRRGTPWSDENWQEARSILIKRAHTLTLQANELPKPGDHEKYEYPWHNPEKQRVTLEDLSLLHNNVIHILQSFLPASDIDLVPLKDQFYPKGHAIGRLSTYFKLQQIISKEQLTHVRLPLKVLVIENKQTNSYMSTKDASEFLEKNIQQVVLNTYHLDTIIYPSLDVETANTYRLTVLAEIQPEHKDIPLSLNAFNDLKTIIEQAPFDVGHDNIFSDKDGNAVIIDTEDKGENPESCISKLGRYNLDQAARAAYNTWIKE